MMNRTKRRPLPSGRITIPHAATWASSVGLAGTALLASKVGNWFFNMFIKISKKAITVMSPLYLETKGDYFDLIYYLNILIAIYKWSKTEYEISLVHL